MYKRGVSFLEADTYISSKKLYMVTNETAPQLYVPQVDKFLNNGRYFVFTRVKLLSA